MNEIFFLMIQPEDFDYTKDQKITGVYMKDRSKKIILDEKGFTAKSSLELKRLMTQRAIFITYNGELLRQLLFKFYGFADYKNIIDLMAIFACIYGQAKGWETEEGSLYIWQKLEVALKYYKRLGINIKDCKVNIYDIHDMLEKTIILYDAMKEYDEKYYDEGV